MIYDSYVNSKSKGGKAMSRHQRAAHDLPLVPIRKELNGRVRRGGGGNAPRIRRPGKSFLRLSVRTLTLHIPLFYGDSEPEPRPLVDALRPKAGRTDRSKGRIDDQIIATNRRIRKSCKRRG